jgi:hypothetical protein
MINYRVGFFSVGENFVCGKTAGDSECDWGIFWPMEAREMSSHTHNCRRLKKISRTAKKSQPQPQPIDHTPSPAFLPAFFTSSLPLCPIATLTNANHSHFVVL